jgi:hypothetical protein
VNRVARLKPEERRELFEETGAQRGMAAAIPEKDFWVCWVLKQLFGDPELREQLVFKGGTTLSKVYKAIDRMSEDIDLVLDWRLLGYPGLLGEEPPSATQKNIFNKAMDAKAADYISGTLLPQLLQLFAPFDGVSAAMEPGALHNIRINYPAEFRANSLLPYILLELGPRASWLPSATHSIRPYAADAFPALFAEPECEVVAIDVGRIFWEKVTILHQQAHRPDRLPERYSRHYYDLYKLAGSEVVTTAAGDFETLAQVVAFKMRFYPDNKARYELAVPGTLRLLPSEEQMGALRRDYAAMREMFFGEIPEFGAVMERLRGLEAGMNRARTGRA